MGEAIAFHATVYKVQTLADGGVRVYLDLPETAIMQMAQLAECQRFGVVLDTRATPLKNSEEQKDDSRATVEARSERKSEWATA